MGLKLKVVRNKKTNQLFVHLPRRKLGLHKDISPKSIDIENIKLNLEECKEKKKSLFKKLF